MRGEPIKMKNYEQFLMDLAVRESGGKYDVVNKLGYLGKYQMGKSALIDAKYYRNDGKRGNNFIDSYWIGKDNVKSKSDFLKNSQAQENAIRDYMKVQWAYLLSDNVDRYIDQTRYSIPITTSGVLAGAHLVGWSNVGPFLKKGDVAEDGNNVPITQYIQKFAGYKTPFEKRKRIIGVQRNEKGEIVSYEIEGLGVQSKESVIQLVKSKKVDAVIVKGKNGDYLRTPPDKKGNNNLGTM